MTPFLFREELARRAGRATDRTGERRAEADEKPGSAGSSESGPKP